MEHQSSSNQYKSNASDILRQLHISPGSERYQTNHLTRQLIQNDLTSKFSSFNNDKSPIQKSSYYSNLTTTTTTTTTSRPLTPLCSSYDEKLGLYMSNNSLRHSDSDPLAYSQTSLKVPSNTLSASCVRNKSIESSLNMSDNQKLLNQIKVNSSSAKSAAVASYKSHGQEFREPTAGTSYPLSTELHRIPTDAGMYTSPACYDMYTVNQQSYLGGKNFDAMLPVSNPQQSYVETNSYNGCNLPLHYVTSASNSFVNFNSEKLPSVEINGFRAMYDSVLNASNISNVPAQQEVDTPDYLIESEDLCSGFYSDYLPNSAFVSKETVEVLGPEEVRWFYKSEGDKKWTPFIGYDSIKIEWAYRQLLHKSITNDRGMHENIDSKCDYKPIGSENSHSGRPVVCGGLYEVDVDVLKGYSIYWKAEEFVIMRGTWYYEGSWMPVEPNIAKQIEAEHLAHFQGTTITTSICIKDSQQGVIHTLALSEGEVDWFSPVDVFFSHDATPSRLMRSVSKKLGFQKTGYKLHRGYCLDASSDDKPPDITHIVFVIHGIGQKMETGRIIKNCTSLRENLKWLKEKQFPGCNFTHQTIEFFPVEWRSNLTLDAGIIDSITPHKIIGIRQMLNASFMDIMYYNSPQYREEIVNGLTCELDRLYTMFTARNPYFEANGGKVSVIAHSLGCVITYDIVTGWSPAPQMSPSFLQALINLTQRNTRAEGEPTLRSFQNALHLVLQQQLEKSSLPRLKFKIENFFCLGSPLSVFLGLRQKRQDSNSPNASGQFFPHGSFRRLFNIFHPADPVAYRIEPLISSKFSSVAPVAIHSYSSADKTPYDEMPPEILSMIPRSSSSRSDTPPDQLETEALSSAVPTTPNKAGTTSWNFLNFIKQPKKGAETSSASVQNMVVEDVNLSEVMQHRMDFVLREGSMESSYLSALTSHTSYWSNMDVAYFLLCTFCPFVLEETKNSQKIS